MKIVNKKDLIDFLDIVSLKGLDPKGKDNPTFAKCMLSFHDNTVTSYGTNKGNTVFFNHTKQLNVLDLTDEVKLPINDIKMWIKYIDDIYGEDIIINIEGSDVILEGDDGSYYKIPIPDARGIEPVIRLPEGPILGYDADAEHLLIDLYENEYLDPNDRYMYMFNPKVLAKATESAKNVSTMTTIMTFKQDGIDIQIGAIPNAQNPSGPQYVYKNIKDVEAEDDIDFDDTEEWITAVGINSVCKTLDAKSVEKSRLYYKDPTSNLLFLGTHKSYEDRDDSYIWMISPVQQAQGEFTDTEEGQ